MEHKTVAIVGLGLIGGSLARDLAARGVDVLGYDSDPATLQAALDAGVLSAALAPDLEGVEAAQVLVLAVPVGRAPGLLGAARHRLGHLRLITDVGSTKEGIVRAVEAAGLGPRFVGGHPLAGDQRAGWHASRTGLFREARVFLSPTTETAPEALDHAHALWRALGAVTEVIDASAHDRELAWTSHLPQALSTTLAHVLGAAAIGRDRLGPGGRDLTRLAGSDPSLWSEIALDNAAALGTAVRAFEETLRRFRVALERRDAGSIFSFFAEGSAWAAAGDTGGFPPRGRGVILKGDQRPRGA